MAAVPLMLCMHCAEYVGSGGLLPRDNGYQAARIDHYVGEEIAFVEMDVACDPVPGYGRCWACQRLNPPQMQRAWRNAVKGDNNGLQ